MFLCLCKCVYVGKYIQNVNAVQPSFAISLTHSVIKQQEGRSAGEIVAILERDSTCGSYLHVVHPLKESSSQRENNMVLSNIVDISIFYELGLHSVDSHNSQNALQRLR